MRASAFRRTLSAFSALERFEVAPRTLSDTGYMCTGFMLENTHQRITETQQRSNIKYRYKRETVDIYDHQMKLQFLNGLNKFTAGQL